METFAVNKLFEDCRTQCRVCVWGGVNPRPCPFLSPQIPFALPGPSIGRDVVQPSGEAEMRRKGVQMMDRRDLLRAQF